MDRDSATTDRLRNLIAKLQSLTASGELHWERQAGSAHRYARWNNHLVILGPATPLSEKSIPRYLFITPFDSPDCIEINSGDAELGSAVFWFGWESLNGRRGEGTLEALFGNQKIFERLPKKPEKKKQRE